MPYLTASSSRLAVLVKTLASKDMPVLKMLIYYGMTNVWKPMISLINYTVTGYNY